MSYLYVTTHEPTGLMYAGVRFKDPKDDPYMGSPMGSNKMRALFDERPSHEFTKEVLFVADDDTVRSDEVKLINALWDEFGKDRVTNLMATFPPPPMLSEYHIESVKGDPVAYFENYLDVESYREWPSIEEMAEDLGIEMEEAWVPVISSRLNIEMGVSPKPFQLRNLRGVFVDAKSQWVKSFLDKGYATKHPPAYFTQPPDIIFRQFKS